MCSGQGRNFTASGRTKCSQAPPEQPASNAPPGWHAGQPALPPADCLFGMLHGSMFKVQYVDRILIQPLIHPEGNLEKFLPTCLSCPVRLACRSACAAACCCTRAARRASCSSPICSKTLRSMYLRAGLTGNWKVTASAINRLERGCTTPLVRHPRMLTVTAYSRKP